MTHHEARLESDLTTIKQKIRAVGTEIENAVGDAVQALLTADGALAAKTILGDLRINREIREIDRLCHAFVARHFPSAGVLRFISSALRIDVALERIGDYAVTICRESVQLSEPPPATIARDVEIMAEHVRSILTQALRSFDEESAELAKGTMGMASHMIGLFQKVFDDLIQAGQGGDRPIRDLFELMLIFNRLERIRAQAKNICEETVFTITGETKESKVYNVLFVDEGNGIKSQLAEAFARKAFPDSGSYSSAGWNPTDRLAPQFLDFMGRLGLSVKDPEPRSLDIRHDALSEHHVVVGLEGDLSAQIAKPPYHTTLVQWTTEPIGDLTDAAFEAAYEEITPRIRDLMEVLRGDQAG